MKVLRRIVVGAALVLALCIGVAGAAQDGAHSLTNDDCVVFMGDSLTAHGGRPYGFVTLFHQMVDREWKERLIKVVEAGQGYDGVAELRGRLDKDVLVHKPTVVVIEIGIADVIKEGAERDLRKAIFKMGMEDLVWRIRRAGARPVLTTLTVVGERIDGSNEYDVLMEAYSQIIRDVGKEKQCRVIEFRKVFMSHLKKVNQKNWKSRILTTPAGIHLNPRGNVFVAKLLLDAFGVPYDPAYLEELSEKSDKSELSTYKLGIPDP
jgi:lysophospholipase L1-like esterase